MHCSPVPQRVRGDARKQLRRGITASRCRGGWPVAAAVAWASCLSRLVVGPVLRPLLRLLEERLERLLQGLCEGGVGGLATGAVLLGDGQKDDSFNCLQPGHKE